MSLSHNTNPRFLGEGNVTKINKNFMFVEDLKYGKIYVRIESALPSKNAFSDLRDVFQIDDPVVYTATRQNEKSDCKYTACSIILKSDLKIVDGTVNELCDRYAYIHSPKCGRVFAPFSARTDGSKHWNGKNAIVGKNVIMKVLPQPELHKCSYVAYAVYNNSQFVNNSQNDDSLSSNKRIEYQPEMVKKQLGIIVSLASDDEEGLIYAQTTGSISYSKSLISGKYEAGYFVFVDVVKKVSDKYEKCLWKAINVDLIGFLPCIKTDYLQNRFNLNESCVTVDVIAIVCRVSHSNASIWLWNDLIGRIFVNNHHYINDLHAMDVVTVKAQFTAAFEDVPWSAISVRPIYEKADELRSEYGQLMITDDDWKVLYVCEQTNGGFYGFMEHPVKGAAFMAWTDLNVGETPPAKGTFCRATVYAQNRDGRHPWRALLVTQLDPETKQTCHDHSKYDNTGNFSTTIAQQIKQQKINLQPPTSTNGNVWTIPSATVTNPKIITQHQTSSSNTSIDSGRASSGLTMENMFSSNMEPPPGFPVLPNSTPIGAERAQSNNVTVINNNNINNGDSVGRPQSIDSFITPENKTNGSIEKYFNPWQSPGPFGNLATAQKTWEPLNLNSTPTLERRNTTNGFDSLGTKRISPLSNLNVLTKEIPMVTDDDGFENYLYTEILKRPNLLKRIITSNEAQRIWFSLFKQPLNNNSTF